MKGLVIIPTYNEKENIAAIIGAIFSKNPQVEIVVVDDSSPDGTGKIVTDFVGEKKSQLHLLTRKKKEGLAKAYIEGFRWGIERNYDVLVQMDADFSHCPEDLAQILEAIELDSVGFIVGSRYVPGGKTENWGWLRIFISRFGSLYARYILGYKLFDWTGGFNGWKKETLEKIGLQNIRSNGYSFQIELKYRALQSGCKGYETPIVFKDRKKGKSKMSFKIFVEAFFRVWQFRFMRMKS